jgi:hypothetical protein
MAADYIKESDLVNDAQNLGIGAIETAVKPVNFLAELIENIRKKVVGEE